MTGYGTYTLGELCDAYSWGSYSECNGDSKTVEIGDE
jgi:hypothetical protein